MRRLETRVENWIAISLKVSGAKIAKPVNLEFRRRDGPPAVANFYGSDCNFCFGNGGERGRGGGLRDASVLKIHLT